jgi:hypothetical protein
MLVILFVCLLWLFFDSQNGGSFFLRKVHKLLRNCTASQSGLASGDILDLSSGSAHFESQSVDGCSDRVLVVFLSFRVNGLIVPQSKAAYFQILVISNLLFAYHPST